MTLVAIDFETSGREAHSACAVGLARIVDGRVADCFYTLLRPPSPRVLFSEIHGLTWSMLKDAPTFSDIWPAIGRFVEGAEYFIAHNASFDRRVLEACLERAALPPLRMPFLCTLKGSRRSLPLPSRRLNVVCDYFNIPLEHHNAVSDATACAEVYLRLRAMGVTDRQMRLS